jgi:CRISPR-associated protein Cmr2
MISLRPNLQFSLGPVQGFIRQARRTRDLWSSSYILSYLSARAMKGVIESGGQIIVPKVWEDTKKDHLLARVMDDRSSDTPRIGTIPNRFQAWSDNPRKAAQAAENQINDAWEKIYSEVWNRFVKDVALNQGPHTQEIWDRQVKNFWEVYWTEGDISTIESRKNWRTRIQWSKQLPELECGDHCTIMGDWQELSGFIRSHDRTERVKQDKFWEFLREKTPGVGRLDFREDERLCSIALIKRMFPKVAKEAIGWDVDANRWPSTLYVAALPWLKDIENKKIDLASSYFNLVKNAADEVAVRREGVWEQVGGSKDPALLDFLELDGNFYFQSTLSNHRHTPLKGTPQRWTNEETDEVKEKRMGLIKQLSKLNADVGREPTPFYCMLLMDGDRMGRLLVDHGEEVSQALAKFGDHVDETVKKFGGVTVYAGGDDVLAMLPVTSGIDCAVKLAKCFEDAFSECKLIGTISAGLVLAHGRHPLRSVLDEAHHILDHIAKEGNGRQSLAVSVLKGSGKYCQWVATFPSLTQGDGTVLDSLVSSLSGEGRHFSTSFFFRVRDILTILSSKPFWQPGSLLELTEEFQEDDIVDLLTAEYIKSEGGKANLDAAKSNVLRLLSVSYRCYRNEQEDCKMDKRLLGADGAMLVKFLAEGGNED